MEQDLPSPLGAVPGQPRPPQKRVSGWGGNEQGSHGALCRHCVMSTGPRRAVMQGAQGVRHCCSRHHEGNPRVLGGGGGASTVFAGSGGGGGLQQQLGTMPFGGLERAPAPSSGGGGGGTAEPGAAVLPRGGTLEPQRGHGRASEEGT